MLRVVLTIVLLMAIGTQAKNFGSIHNVFEIEEERFLTMIARQTKNIDAVGFQQAWTEKLRASSGKFSEQLLPEATEYRSRIVDMRFVLEEDLKAADGQIVHKKGMIVDPLELIDLEGRIFLFDGSKSLQVEWLKKQKLNDEDILILTNGSPDSVSEELQRDVFFDQLAEFTKRFQIQAVPSVVHQREKGIMVEEYAPL